MKYDKNFKANWDFVLSRIDMLMWLSEYLSTKYSLWELFSAFSVQEYR